jgi:cytochrome b involved in lipid metabolism
VVLRHHLVPRLLCSCLTLSGAPEAAMALWKAATPAAVLGPDDAFPGLPVQRVVTSSELSGHSTKKDSWIAIRGKV